MPPTETDPGLARRLRAWQRGALVLLGLALGLGAAVGVLLRQPSPAQDLAPEAAARLSPEALEKAVEELVRSSRGMWDTFADPDVGRVAQSNPAQETNRYGLRERTIDFRRPKSGVRIVLLGDSFVFGAGIDLHERIGVHLASRLDAALPEDVPPVDCLHVGLVSWNVRAECAYLHRSLGLFQPDLVFHVVVANDLDDVAGARGFGAMTEDFSPQQPFRPGGVISATHPITAFGLGQRNWLHEGLDWESRSRYEQAAADLGRLAAEVERLGGRYQLVNYWDLHEIAAATAHLYAGLRPDQVLHLSSPQFRDPQFVVSETDHHWNGAACARVARYLHGAILVRGLLPALPLPEDPDARAFYEEMEAAGVKAQNRGRRNEKFTVEPAVDFRTWDTAEKRQVHGGVDREGRASPYASLILARGDGTRLRLAARCLDRPELDGATVEVYVEEARLATRVLAAGERIEVDEELPADVRDRDHLSVRLVASDYVYDPEDFQHCISLQLERVAIE